jgi:hypothetical protein
VLSIAYALDNSITRGRFFLIIRLQFINHFVI